MIHKLSHRTLHLYFYRIDVKQIKDIPPDILIFPIKKLHEIPVPSPLEKYFKLSDLIK